MTAASFQPLDIAEFWEDLNGHLIELTDAVPEDKLDWRPAPGEWSFFDIAVHVANACHHWLTNSIQDGQETTPPQPRTPSAVTVTSALVHSWARMARFLADEDLLARRYASPPNDPEYLDPDRFDGHFVAFHRLVHDAHHRADILRLMDKIGAEPPVARRRRPPL